MQIPTTSIYNGKVRVTVPGAKSRVMAVAAELQRIVPERHGAGHTVSSEGGHVYLEPRQGMDPEILLPTASEVALNTLDPRSDRKPRRRKNR